MAAASGAAGSAAGASSTGADVIAMKKQARLSELHQTYSMIRAQPFTLAIVLKLNWVPPPPPPVEEVPVEVPETATKGKDAKNKGKGKK